MSREFMNKRSSVFGQERDLVYISSIGVFNYSLSELHISYKTYIENIDKSPAQIKKIIQSTFQKAGMEKDDFEVEIFLELASATRKSTMALFRHLKNIG